MDEGVVELELADCSSNIEVVNTLAEVANLRVLDEELWICHVGCLEVECLVGG